MVFKFAVKRHLKRLEDQGKIKSDIRFLRVVRMTFFLIALGSFVLIISSIFCPVQERYENVLVFVYFFSLLMWVYSNEAFVFRRFVEKNRSKDLEFAP